jgi:hypothetical protein
LNRLQRPLALLLLLALSACSGPPSSTVTDAELVGDEIRYTVREGDTWGRVSEAFFGDASRAERIARDNGFHLAVDPVEGVDVNWQVAFFSINRYKRGDFFRSCGAVVVPFDVPNIGQATGTDSFGEETVSDDATVTVYPGIAIGNLKAGGKKVTVDLTNLTPNTLEIAEIDVSWPTSNGHLRTIRLDGSTIWTGSDAPPSVSIDSGWSGGATARTLEPGTERLQLDFRRKAAKTEYKIRVEFTDGTFVSYSN